MNCSKCEGEGGKTLEVHGKQYHESAYDCCNELMKRRDVLNHQLSEATAKERQRIVTIVQDLICKEEAKACTERHIGYNGALQDVLGEIEEASEEQKEGNGTLLERMNSLYSLLSLVRHRHLHVPDDLLRDIDKALAEGEKILKPWWDEQVAAKNASTKKVE